MYVCTCVCVDTASSLLFVFLLSWLRIKLQKVACTYSKTTGTMPRIQCHGIASHGIAGKNISPSTPLLNQILSECIGSFLPSPTHPHDLIRREGVGFLFYFILYIFVL
ncbi:hypothetical protein J3Q64DRAFT_1740086 [Phycomyces blakesleeanus]|uniref:Uncharacterized protein n=1 Tax=Phycomyces blakesleeanus TaxID=4837 RepID=A0ABR3B0Q2_PHYBL